MDIRQTARSEQFGGQREARLRWFEEKSTKGAQVHKRVGGYNGKRMLILEL